MEFSPEDDSWTGDMSAFLEPSLFFEVPELTCESVGGGSRDDAQDLSVLMLSKYVNSPEPEQNQTDFQSDTALARLLCNSREVAISTTFFNGGDGNAEQWEAALEDVDVLVLPETDGPLLGSDLLTQNAMDYIESWVSRDGGRVIMVGASNYKRELENLIGIESDTLEVESFGGLSVDRFDAARALDRTLPIESDESSAEAWDRSQFMLKIDNDFWSNVYSRDVSVSNLYGGSQNDLSFSAATLFEIDRGQATYLSSNFEGGNNQGWNEVFMQSVYGTATSGFNIRESEKSWYLTGTGAYWNEMSPGARFELGSNFSIAPISCINTPTNPALRTVTAAGTEIVCGSQYIQYGQVDAGVTGRVSRFVTASGDWMSSEIAITNLDRTDSYSDSLWFGGSQGIGSTMSVEATSSSPTGSTNLISESYGSDNPASSWMISSAGTGLDPAFDSYNSEIISRLYGTPPSSNYGGSGRDDNPRLGNDEIKSQWLFEIAAGESFSVQAIIGRTSFQPGCDRAATAVTRSAIQQMVEAVGPIDIPSLFVECQPFNAAVNEVQTVDLGGSARVTWDRVEQAEQYEISLQLEGSEAWSEPIRVNADGNERSSHLFNSLTVGQAYKFRVRPIDVDRNIYGDTAIGTWVQSGLLAISPATPPSSAPPQNPPQSNNPAPAPAQVIPQMIAQTSPGFPARLKKGKTVKFGITAPSGLPLRVSTVGKCKTTKITKKVTVKVLVGKKIKKKKVTVQTGWAVKGSKKGTCTITFSNSGDATRSPLASAGTITVF
jgi:hypothetical protein